MAGSDEARARGSWDVSPVEDSRTRPVMRECINSPVGVKGRQLAVGQLDFAVMIDSYGG